MELNDLSDVVVIAGPNGTGKSCILDALRLFKSLHGQYYQGELQQWFGEFQINIQQDATSIANLLRDRSKSAFISCSVELSESEIDFVSENAFRFVSAPYWRMALQSPEVMHGGASSGGAYVYGSLDSFDDDITHKTNDLVNEVQSGILYGEISFGAQGESHVKPSPALHYIFSNYIPSSLGVMDYHSAHRQYNREHAGGIQVGTSNPEQQRKQHALYNTVNKYNAIRSELASQFAFDAIAEKAGWEKTSQPDLADTLKSMFTTFFPDKEFIGAVPLRDGTVGFSVRTASGAEHDINDLSSGEKEILYGYLRLRQSAPRNSIILLDEPEVHLNPRLIKGLPGFYHKHLGIELSNQIWLITHSDTLLREVIGQNGFSVYHMTQPFGVSTGKNQAHAVTANLELDSLLYSLVGDVAAYNPRSPLIIMEGGGDVKFDELMVTTLFSQFAKRVNFVSGNNKRRVRDLHNVMDNLRNAGVLPFRAYSIVDRDTEYDARSVNGALMWDVYHIENYLLNATYIFRVLSENHPAQPFLREEDVLSELMGIARSTVPNLISRDIKQRIFETMRPALDISFNSTASNAAELAYNAMLKSHETLRKITGSTMTLDKIKEIEEEAALRYKGDLEDGSWVKTFPGRPILERFSGKYLRGMKYEYFRNQIMYRMRDDGFQPIGMKDLIAHIDLE